MKNATFRQLRFFNAVARHLSFAKAAELMHVSAPAVTMQIKELEAEVGMPLFERQGRKVSLTTTGEYMLVYSRKMLALLKEQKADILCLQEFHTSENPGYYNNIRAIREELGFSYHYFPYDKDGDRNYYSSVIFSRFPIVDSALLRYPRPSQPEVLVQADIQVNNDTIRVFTTHLQSQRFDKLDYARMQKIKSREDSLVYHSIPIVAKLKRGIVIRSIQADIIEEVRNNSPYPVLFTGDLNDVPNSYTYFKVRGELRDAFLEKVWEWRHQYGDKILQQLHSLGISCDWNRTLFTMDESASHAVTETFIRLFDEGLIYRGKRIINWSPIAQSALSDEEVMEMFQKEHENPGYVDDDEELTEADYWDGDSSYCE